MDIVQDFLVVFPYELPRLPPDRKVELAIELYLGSLLVPITLYRMAPNELKELKIQLRSYLIKVSFDQAYHIGIH